MKNSKARNGAKGWLAARNIRVSDVQGALGFKYPTQVSDTLNGNRNNREVLEYLKKIGCPERHLKLPEGMRGKDGL